MEAIRTRRTGTCQSVRSVKAALDLKSRNPKNVGWLSPRSRFRAFTQINCYANLLLRGLAATQGDEPSVTPIFPLTNRQAGQRKRCLSGFNAG